MFPEIKFWKFRLDITLALVVFKFRPEVVESYFYMWRFTKDQKYRDWAWEAVLVRFHYSKNH